MKYKIKDTLFLSISINICFIMIILAIVWGILKENPATKFEEYGFITKFSTFQLTLCGIIGALTFKRYKKLIWLLISFGFFFLALDETFMIHENIDILIHHTLKIQETDFSDKIDDFIILLYGVIGGIFLLKNRKEFLHNKNGVFILVSGFILMVMSVVFDTISNTDHDVEVISALLKSTSPISLMHHSLTILEESTKVISEAFLLSGLYSYWVYKIKTAYN